MLASSDRDEPPVGEGTSDALQSERMLLEEFDYFLPPGLVAQRPLAERDASRMLVLHRASQVFEDRVFRELPEVLQPGDLLVVNNTKVFPARLLGRRLGTKAQKIGKHNPAARKHLTGEVELMLTRQLSEHVWEGLVHPGRKVRTGEILLFGEGELQAEVLSRGDYGLRRVRLRARDGSVQSAIEHLGHVPLPPYIRRPDEPADREAYQTVFARVPGAIAAPTAGLHFTGRLLETLRSRGIATGEVTLHVGLATFQPVRTKHIEDHKMESEQYEVSAQAAEAINRALDQGRRVVAVGTTVVRTLEHAVMEHGRIVAGRGKTTLFITPGFRFRVVKALLTNFHLPKSTLLMLICAFGGREFVLRAYAHAIAERYRFYSYGDCMLLL